MPASQSYTGLRTPANVDFLREFTAIALGALGFGSRLNIAIGAIWAAPGLTLAIFERRGLRRIGGLPVRLVKLGAKRAAEQAAKGGAADRRSNAPWPVPELVADHPAGHSTYDRTRRLAGAGLCAAGQGKTEPEPSPNT